MRSVWGLLLLCLMVMAACRNSPPAASWEGPPLAYADPSTGIIVYVESDGRHVAAVDAEGRLLWHKDAIAEAAPKPGADGNEPTISGIDGPPASTPSKSEEQGKGPRFLTLRLTNGALVKLDEQTGEAAPQ